MRASERTGFNLYEAYFISFLERFFMTARTGLLFDIIKGHFIDWFAGVSCPLGNASAGESRWIY